VRPVTFRNSIAELDAAGRCRNPVATAAHVDRQMLARATDNGGNVRNDGSHVTRPK
jgi:hypothetical protein